MPPKSSCVLPLTSTRASGEVGVEALDSPVVEWQHVVPRGPRRARAAATRRASPASPPRGRAPGVQSSVRRRAPRRRRRTAAAPVVITHGMRVARDGSPALVVDAAVAEHLEVLGRPALGCTGVVERVRHADTVDRRLLDAVDDGRLRKRGPPRARSVRCRSRGGTASGSRPAPRSHGASARSCRCGPAPVGRDLLRPLVRRVHSMCPADRVVVVRRRGAELVDLRGHELRRLERGRSVEDERSR